MPTRHRLRGMATLLLLVSVFMGLAQTGLLAVPFVTTEPIMHSVPIPLGMSPSAVAVDARTGRAFITGDRAAVSVVATRSGRILTTTLLDEVPSAPVVDERDGRIYVTIFNDPLATSNGGNSGSVDVLDARTGALLHTVQLGGQPSGQPGALAVDEQSARVFVLSFNDVRVGGNSVTVLEGKSGRVLRTIRLMLGPQSLAIDEHTNRVFVQSNGDAGPNASGSLSLLDATSGRLLRTVTLGPLLGAPAVDALTGRAFVVENGPHGGQVRMLDATSGRILRTTRVPIGAGIVAFTLDTQTRRIYVSSTGGPVCMLDAATGRLLRTLPQQRWGWGIIPVVAESTARLFVPISPDTVSVLDARTGTVLRTVTVGHSSAPIADIVAGEHAHRVLVVTQSPTDRTGIMVGRGQVAVLDARTGAILHTMLLGVNPTGVGVDERSGRVVILNGGGTLRTSDDWGWLPQWLRRRLWLIPPAPPALRHMSGSVSTLDATR